MSSELENIILTIDTREQNQKRIKAIEDWAVSHGAIVEYIKLNLCDYRIMGEFRGIPVNLGIEAKSLSDFCSCGYEELKGKLFDSFELYDDVALFIETGNYTYKFVEGIAVIDNPAVRDGSANVCPLAVLEGCCSTLPTYDIHVRQLRSEMQFPDSIWNLLTYTTTPQHTMVKTKEYPKKYKQVLLRFLTPIQTKKVMTSYPNFHWLASASEESLKAVLGSKTGQAVNDFLHSHELETEAWRNNYCRDGTEKDEPEKLICSACGEDKCTCVPNFDNPKLLKENEGAQAFDARPKTPIKCDFADPKNHEVCKTPDHFKQLSKSLSIEQQGSNPVSRRINKDLEARTQAQKSMSGESKLGTLDTSSHPGIITTIPKIPPDDPRVLPPQMGAVKQGIIAFSPAENHEDIGLDSKPLECVVKCRACHQVIIPEQDDDTGFCQDAECIEARKKPAHAKNLIDSLKSYLNEPHTVPEIVKEFGVTSGYAFSSCMGGVKGGWLKKVTEQNGKTTFKRIQP